MDSKSLHDVHSSIDTTQKVGFFKKLFAFMGPAYLVSVGYMDPGNWATDIAGGSQFGYSLVWVLVMSNLMALLLQSLSAKLGIVTRMDLAQANRKTFPKKINFCLYILAELAIIACDLAEVLGMAIGLNLLFNIPLIWGVVITSLDTFLIFFLIGKGMRRMEAFIIGLISLIGISFIFEMIFAKPELGEIAKGLIPTIKNDTALYIAIGIIGATVMPHNLYLHSALVQTRKFKRDLKSIKEAIKFNIIDSFLALNLALFVNAAILILAASTFYNTGRFDVSEIKDAYLFLEPILGTNLAPILFAVALIAAGQSSTLTGTLAGQIVMEGYLNLRLEPWIRRLITRLIAIIPAVLVILIMGENYVGKLLVFSQVVLSLQLGFAIIPLIHFVSDKKLMGNFKISIVIKIIAWVVVSIIVSLNIKLVYAEISDWIAKGINPFLLYCIVFPIVFGCIFLLCYVLIFPIIRKDRNRKSNIHTALALEDLQDFEYNKIALAIDFSGLENKIISSALHFGNKNSVYYLIHIVESPAARLWEGNTDDAESLKDKEMLKEVQQFLEQKGYQTEIRIGYGNPSEAISEIAKINEIDIMILGAHGHNWFKDLLFGTTISGVRHKLNIPIFIVK